MKNSESTPSSADHSATPPPLPASIPRSGPGNAKEKTAARLFVRSSENPAAGSSEADQGAPGNESKRPASTVVTSPDVGVVVFGQDRKIISANDICSAMFGWPNLPGQDLGILLQDGVQPELGEILLKDTKNLKGSERFSLRVKARRKDKSQFQASLILTVSAAGTKACWTAIFQDLDALGESAGNTTIMRNASGELQRHCDDMAVEVATYREELDQSHHDKEEMQVKLKELMETKENMELQLQQQMQTHEQLLQDLSKTQEELDEIKSNASQQEAEINRDSAQIEHLKDDLLGMRKTLDELNEQLLQEQQASLTVLEENQKLQLQLQEAQAKVDQSQTGQDEQTEQLRGELGSLKEQLESARMDAQETESRLQQESDKVKELEKKLATPSGEATAELHELKERQADWEQSQSEMENRLGEVKAQLARANADLEKERRERRRVEQRNASLSTQLQEMHEELKHHLETERGAQDRFSELEEQLRQREETATRLEQDLQKITADFALAEEQLAAAGDMSQELERYRSLFEESKDSFQRTQEQLESQLQGSQRALRDHEATLEQESSERQRLQERLTRLQRDYQELGERTSLELTKLKSELQVEQLERKRLEGGAVQSRYATLDSARTGRALVTRLHKQVKEPVEDLLGSARQLLENELPEDQKSLLESMLEKALLVQTNLEELNASSKAPNAPAKPEGAESSGESAPGEDSTEQAA